MANLGSQIGGAITQYKKKKEEKQLTEQAANMILSYAQKNPDAASELGVTDLETAKVAIKSLGGAAPTLQMLSQLQPAQEFKPSVENVAGQPFVETSKGKFAPMPEVKEKRQTVDITAEQVQDYINRGVKIKGEPLASGGMRVTDAETLAPRGPSTVVNVGGEKADTSAYDKKMAEKTADVAVNWETGGRVNAIANLSQYKDIEAGLMSGEIDTRTLVDFSPVLSDEMRNIFNPTGAAALDNVRKVVFQSLRDTLGAQFTEKEGIRLTNATYNPALSEEENIKRMRIAGSIIEETIAAKDRLSAFIQSGGKMKDYKGQTPIDVFNESISGLEKASGEKPKSNIPEGIDPAIWNEMSEDDRKLWN